MANAWCLLLAALAARPVAGAHEKYVIHGIDLRAVKFRCLHRWLAFDGPDPQNIQYKAACNAVRAVFGLPVALFFTHAALENFTLAIELRRRRRSDAETWDICDRRIYSKHATIAEIRPRRHLCVYDRVPKNSTKLFIFVHGSMARLSQFAAQISYFGSNGYGVVVEKHLAFFACTRTIRISGFHINPQNVRVICVAHNS